MQILRTIALICVVGPLSAMLFEPFFESVFDIVGWDSEDLAGPFVSMASKAMNWIGEHTAYLVGFMGFGIGVLAHYFVGLLASEKQDPSRDFTIESSEMLSMFGADLAERRIRFAAKVSDLWTDANNLEPDEFTLKSHAGDADIDILCATDADLKKKWLNFKFQAARLTHNNKNIQPQDFEDMLNGFSKRTNLRRDLARAAEDLIASLIKI